MKSPILLILLILAAITPADGQADNTLYVGRFPGETVGAKLMNAMASCNSDSHVPCILVIDPSLATFPAGAMPSLCAQCVLHDNRTPGTLPTMLDNVRYASQFPGSDWVIKVNAADTDLGAECGEIWVSQNAGTAQQSPAQNPAEPALTLGTCHAIRFAQGGVYSITRKINAAAGSNSSIYCGVPAPSGGPACTIQAAAGAGLSGMIDAGSEMTIRDMAIDGNQANGGTSGSSAYLVNLNPKMQGNYGRQTLDSSTFINSSGHGVVVPNMIVPKFSRDIIQFNKGDGISCSGSTDMFIGNETEIEGNGLSGVELDDCGAARIEHSDFGLNNGLGGYGALYIHGTNANRAGYNIITGNQFGNDLLPAIYIQSVTNGTYTAGNNTIVGNSFMGNCPGAALPFGTFPGYGGPIVRIIDGYGNQIVGNYFNYGTSATYGLQFSEDSAGVSNTSTVTGNTFNTGFAKGYYTDGNQANPNFYIGNVEGTSGYQRLGPNTYFRNGDSLSWLNASGRLTHILSLDASNNLWMSPPAGFTIQSGVTVSGGSLLVTGGNVNTAGIYQQNGNNGYNATFNCGAGQFVNSIPLAGGIILSASPPVCGPAYPAVVAQPAAYTAQRANISPTTVFANASAGRYRITCSVLLTQAATTGSTLPGCQGIWTDVTTSQLVYGEKSGTVATNNIGASTSGINYADVKAGTNIQFQTTAYASSGSTAMQYKVIVAVERLQ